jgi:DNA-binding IclR family transcriptional regulator
MSDSGSAERAFAILGVYGRVRRPLSNRKQGELCGLPESTCHNLVRMQLTRA